MKKMLLTLLLIGSVFGGVAFAAESCCPGGPCCGGQAACCK